MWAFLSDIHGNATALARALQAARDRGATRLAYLGDLLGPGDPDRCVALVRETAELSLVGNRDLDWADRVSEAARAYVRSLPRRAAADGFVAVHGDLTLTPGIGSGDLRTGFRRTHQVLLAGGHHLLFFGHTHHARVWLKDGPANSPVLLSGDVIRLDPAPDRVHIINVGTIGRPFPGKGPASFTLYDPAERVVTMVPVPRPT